MKIYYDVTFQTVTEESAEQGDFADQGYQEENNYVESFRELVDLVSEYPEPSYYPLNTYSYPDNLWFSTVDPDVNYTTGENTYYSLHIKNKRALYHLVSYLQKKRANK